jgi:hypothetical protein
VIAASDCLKKAGSAECRDITGIFRGLETYPDMALGTKVKHFIRLEIIHDICDLFRIGKIPVMKKHPGMRIMGVNIDLVNPARVERR